MSRWPWAGFCRDPFVGFWNFFFFFFSSFFRFCKGKWHFWLLLLLACLLWWEAVLCFTTSHLIWLTRTSTRQFCMDTTWWRISLWELGLMAFAESALSLSTISTTGRIHATTQHIRILFGSATTPIGKSLLGILGSTFQSTEASRHIEHRQKIFGVLILIARYLFVFGSSFLFLFVSSGRWKGPWGCTFCASRCVCD